MSKYVLFSDIHFGQQTEFSKTVEYKGRAVDSRLLDGLTVLDQVEYQADKHKARGIIFCGDLFHDRYLIDIAVMNFVRLRIKKMAKKYKVILLKGNHDEVYDDEELITSTSMLQGIKNVIIINKPKIYKDMVFIPYCSDPMKALKETLRDATHTSRLKYLFAHLTPNGARVSGSELLSDVPVDDNKQLAKFKRCFTGHIHRPQKIGAWTILGSPMQMNYGEKEEDKFIYVLNTKNNNLEEIYTEAPRFVEIIVRSNSDLIKHRKTVNKNYVRATVLPEIRTKYPENLEKLISYSKGWSEYYEVQQGEEVTTGIQRQEFPDLIKQYVEQAKPESLKTKKLLDLGNEYVDGLTDVYYSGGSITLKTMKIRNFMLFKSLDVKFSKGKITLITGENGQGKSALIEAVYYALTGKTIRKSKAARVIRTGAKLCTVELALDFDGDKYTIRRSRKAGKGSITLLKGKKAIKLKGKIQDRQKALEELFGISAELLTYTSFIMVKSPVFAELTNTQKSDLLLNSIVGAGALNKAGTRARKSLSVLNKAIDRFTGAQESHTQQLAELKDARTELLKSQNQDMKKYNRQMRSYKKYRHDVQFQEDLISKYTKKLDKAASVTHDLGRKVDVMEVKCSNLALEIQEIDGYVTKGKCPACGQGLKKKTDKELAKIKLKGLKTELKTKEKIRLELSEIFSKNRDIIRSMENKNIVCYSRINNMKVREKPVKVNRKEFSKTLALIKKVRGKITKHKKLLIARQRKVPYVEFWVDAFSNHGLKQLILESIIGLMNIFVHDSVNQLSQGNMSAGVIIGEKGSIDIEVKTKSGGESYEEVSSGQQARIDIAMMSALESISSNYNITRLSNKFIDERYAYLDEKGHVAMLDTLRAISKDSGNSFMIVDRNPIVKPYADEMICL